ncbi:hypothetical protein FXO38_36272 [Capsicum annuum]|nr:hypothetical protein FXO38_36272 [Capsicum annuum]
MVNEAQPMSKDVPSWGEQNPKRSPKKSASIDANFRSKNTLSVADSDNDGSTSRDLQIRNSQLHSMGNHPSNPNMSNEIEENDRKRKRRISKQRQIEEEKEESTRLEQFVGEDRSTRLEKSTEEKDEETGGADTSSTNADASNNKFKSNENAEGENRGFEDKQKTKHQHDTPILEEETSHVVESSSTSPSPDTSLVKPIRYLDYSFETLIERFEHELLSEWVLLSDDRDAFSAYPWGHVSYDLRIEYLLKVVNPNVKTSNLYGFPWAFMIVHPWISPTPSEMDMDFLTSFMPLQLTKDDKIEKIERDLNGVGAIKRDYTVVEGDLDPSRAVYVGGTVIGESSSPNVDRGSSSVGAGGGEESSLFVTSGLGGFSGGFGVGRSPINENVSCPQETPSTIEVPSCKPFHEKIDLLTARVDALEKAITTMMSKRGIWSSSKILYPYTPEGVKRQKKIKNFKGIVKCQEKSKETG